MNIENEFKKRKRKIDTFLVGEEIKKISENNTNFEDKDLDDKVNNFIDWYTDNLVKGHYTDIGEYHKPRDLRNFIEKMAVWYELRYPDYEVNRIMYCCGQERISVNEVMFNDNKYINDLFDENDDIRHLDWDEFYNTKSFINSLPYDEKYYLLKVKYADYTRLLIDDFRDIIFYLTSNGFIEKIHETYCAPINDKYIERKDFIGKNIKDAVIILKDKYECTDDQLKKIYKTIKDFENYKYFKEELLNCVMYRIIERGGTNIGSRRAFLFAQEFNRNIDIPVMYGIDTSSPGLREFINLYLKAGGSKDLVCFTNYGCRVSKREKLNTTTIQELIKNHWENAVEKYTKEETKLHQRLINSLVTQIDPDIVRQEEVKKLRLQRK